MASTKRRLGKEEFARRGDKIFERDIRPNLSATDEGKFVAVDVATGSYEIGTEELEVCDLLRARLPQAQIWMVRVGSRYVHRFGSHLQSRP